MSMSSKAALVLGLAVVAVGGILASSGSAGEAVAPASVSPPTLGGLVVGQTLAASPGKWSGAQPFTYLYSWIRSDGGDGTVIKGAGGPTYTLTPDDIGHKIFVQVKAMNAAGYQWSNSTWTSYVSGPSATDSVKLADGRVSLAVSGIALPDRLVVAGFDTSPLRLRASGTVIARITVVDRLKRPVRGALVQVTALPFGSLEPAAETPTDVNGVATIVLRGRPSVLKHVSGGAIALSVRARKPGDDVLTGVTAQRLVQLRTGS
jgi:hypothetical protein